MNISSPRVWVFFYGTFLNRNVLVEHGITPTEVISARLNGFELYIRPRVNLVRVDKSCVYGTLAAITHEDIAKLYSSLEENFGLKYFPEPVMAETLDGAFRLALCYLASNMHDAPAEQDFINQLAACAREAGFPEWYAAHIETFGPGSESGN